VVLHPTYVEALLVGLAQLLAVAAPAGSEGGRGGRRRWAGKLRDEAAAPGDNAAGSDGRDH